MRPLAFAALLLLHALPAAEAAARFPFWDGRESVAAYAARVNLPPVKSFDLGHGVTLDLVLIPAGQFTMGSPKPPDPTATVEDAGVLLCVGAALVFSALMIFLGNFIQRRKFAFSLRWLLFTVIASGFLIAGFTRWHLAEVQAHQYFEAMKLYDDLPANEKHAHLETIEAPFYMAKFTVTQAQYEAVTGTNPSTFKGPQLPVETVSWNDVSDFCAKLSAKLKTQFRTSAAFTLPTEAQWEYACRAGTTTEFNTGDTISTDEANFDGSAASPYLRIAGINRGKTISVGSFKPNAFGLYDMHGNVWQWCKNAFHEDNSVKVEESASAYYARNLRGGFWDASPWMCRSASRMSCLQDVRSSFGFRIILPLDF